VLSNLKGHVLLKGGTARFSNLSFSVPGAVAQLHGPYDLISELICTEPSKLMPNHLRQLTG
jgi:hypothetical protein